MLRRSRLQRTSDLRFKIISVRCRSGERQLLVITDAAMIAHPTGAKAPAAGSSRKRAISRRKILHVYSLPESIVIGLYVNSTSPRRSNDEIIRSMIEKENDYIHHRVTWFCTLQGLLLAALSFTLRQGAGHFDLLLCILGGVVAGIVLHPIYYAHRATMGLLDWWDAHKPSDYDGPDVIGARPPNRLGRYIGPWTLLPAIFFLAWCVILWWRLHGP